MFFFVSCESLLEQLVAPSNDYSTYLCTVDGVAVPLKPFAIATVVCKWLLQNSYGIYCTQADRVIIASKPGEIFLNTFNKISRMRGSPRVYRADEVDGPQEMESN